MDEKEADNTDIVTRYIKDLKKHYSSQGKTLKYNAFMDKRYPCEISVYGIRDLLENNQINEIWNIADEYAFKNANKKVKGRGDLLAGKIREISENTNKLNVYYDFEPIDRHANIKFSPINDAISKLTAMSLANISDAYLK